MSEWWSYGLSDFLMFSPSTYWRMVERYNRELWPLHLHAGRRCDADWVGTCR